LDGKTTHLALDRRRSRLASGIAEFGCKYDSPSPGQKEEQTGNDIAEFGCKDDSPSPGQEEEQTGQQYS
jgi:hypothetical protein